jgi:Protein of unknown function (DUF2815)
MSQTMAQGTPVQIDPYLAAATMPPNDFTIDPQYHNMRITTPIGRFAYIHVAAPHAIRQADGSAGKLMFNATLLMAPGTEQQPIVLDLHRAACMVADTHWPAVDRVDPQSGGMVKVKGSDMFWVDSKLGGFHYPLRRGDESYIKEPAKFAAWRGLWFINCGMAPKTKSGIDQRPVCLDEQGNETDPARFYPGCYGRLNVTVAPFDNMGNKGVTFYLNAVQFAKHGERMATGFDTVAAAKNAFGKAGALPVAEPMQPQGGFPTGFGPNSAGPGNVPPGIAVPGFAQPPAQAPMQMQPSAPIPPQQPWAPTGGVRPPGG